jgi:hypothetical protein
MKIRNGTIIIDLGKPEGEIWKGLHKSIQRSVDRARREGVAIREGGDHDACYGMYATMCMHNKLIPFTRQDVFSRGRLLTACKGDRIVAFIVFKEEGDKATMSINASDYEFRHTQANSLLYWDSILYYKRNGFKILDLGGVDLHAKSTEGIDMFKMKWGGKLVERTQEATFVEYIWWKYLRHSATVWSLKYRIQTALHKGQ